MRLPRPSVPPELIISIRQAASSSASHVAVQKPFDWTYTTLYPGSVSLPPGSSEQNVPTFVKAPEGHPGIPMHELARQDVPILFYEEIPLFEDELGDNGIAELVVRVVRLPPFPPPSGQH